MNLHFYRKKNNIRKESYNPSSKHFLDFLVKFRIWINLEINHKMSKYCIFWKAILFCLYRIYNCAHIIIKITKYCSYIYFASCGTLQKTLLTIAKYALTG